MMGKLTGRTRLRSTWTGKLVLQVEEERRAEVDPDGSYLDDRDYTVWRDANVTDLRASEIRDVIAS